MDNTSPLSVPKKIRLSMLERYDFLNWLGIKKKCPYCNRILLPDERKDIAHITAKSNLGQAVKGNLCLAHHSCNIQKGSEKIIFSESLNNYIVY